MLSSALAERSENDISLAHCDHCEKIFDAPSGNYYHMSGCSVLLNKVKRLQIKMMAANIRSVAQFRKIIFDAQPKMRCEVYDLIAPNITKFIPPPYLALCKSRGPRGR
jgi:hypothetical protein